MENSIAFKISFRKYETVRITFSLRENYQLKASPNSESQGTMEHTMQYPWNVPACKRMCKRTIFIHGITPCEDCKLKQGYALFPF